MAGAVGLTVLAVSDSRSRRWEGVILVTAYLAVAVGFAVAGNR
jgi:Ca2+/H+ antiporter